MFGVVSSMYYLTIILSMVGSIRVEVKDDRPVSCWEEDDKLFCVAPNLVCTDIYQTGGGGDNISAAGLAPQILAEQ